MKRCLLATLSCLILLVSSQCYGPVYPKNIFGVTLESDAPLLISTYAEGLELFSNLFTVVMDKIGFLNISILDPSACLFSRYATDVPEGVWGIPSSLYAKERASYFKSLFEVQSLSSFGDNVGFSTNRRVIVYANGPLKKRNVIKLVEGKSTEYEPKEFGELLGDFFMKNNIEVGQVDLILPRGKVFGPQVMEGMKNKGMKDFIVRCFNGRAVYRVDGCIHIDGFDNQPDREVYIDSQPFFISGEVKSLRPVPDADELIETFTEGNPTPTEPLSVQTPSCTQ